MWLRISDRTPVTAAHRARGGRHPAWRQALVFGPLITVAVYAVGTLAATLKLPALAVIVGCLAVGAVLVMAALLRAKNGLSAIHGCACGIVAAGWLAYACRSAPWSWTVAVALLVPAAVLIPLYPVIREREDLAAEKARRDAEAAAAAQEQNKWPDLLARIGHTGIKFAGQEDTLAGYMVHLRLPGSGRVTYSALAPATEQLEVAARLRHGSLRFERGNQAHKVILHVAVRDVLAETVPFPAGHGTLSITRPMPLGLFEDGQVCAVTLREIATLIVGLRGSGKSNLLNVLLAQLARCADVLIFAIDLKGGRMAAPWIEPWLAGRTPKPVVDWLATDREEAERMLRALLRAVNARSRSGSGGEKIIPSPRQPAILLVCDEIAVILGIGVGGPRTSLEGVTNATLAGLATQLVMTGRSEAIDLIMATQRGTATMTGSADLKSQCGLRIGLGVASEADARLIIPDDVRIAADLARLRHPGTGIVQQGKLGRVVPAKFYRIEHDAISQIAERYGPIRPGPDKLLEDALGEDYASRWSPERAAKIPGVGSRPMVPAGIPAPYGGADEPLAGRAARPSAGAGPGALADAGHPARRRMVAMLKSAGVRGMTVRGIAEQLAADGQEIAQQTIYRWLTEEAAAGRVENASYGRWKWRADW
jgi:DNA translocase FtsK/SpoIIIE-like protein